MRLPSRLNVCTLEDRATPAHLFAVAADTGGAPEVHVYDAAGALKHTIVAYDAAFTGGVRAATGDVTGDGTDDIITVPGPGGGAHVRVFDGATGREVRSFLSDDSTARIGLTVAAGDVTGDGRADIVLGTGLGGGPRVQVFDGATGNVVRNFFAYGSSARGGVAVATGDVNGDGRADLVTGAGPGGGPHVKVYDGATGGETRSLFAYDPSFTGGVSVAAADVTGDGRADLVTGPGQGAGPHVKVFNGVTGSEVRAFFAYGSDFRGGVNVAAGDLDGNGTAEIVTAAGPGGGPHVKVFDGATAAQSFLAFHGTFVGGVATGNGSAKPPAPPAPVVPVVPPVNNYPAFNVPSFTMPNLSGIASISNSLSGIIGGLFF